MAEPSKSWPFDADAVDGEGKGRGSERRRFQVESVQSGCEAEQMGRAAVMPGKKGEARQ